jgi:hypothetical protein
MVFPSVSMGKTSDPGSGVGEGVNVIVGGTGDGVIVAVAGIGDEVNEAVGGSGVETGSGEHPTVRASKISDASQGFIMSSPCESDKLKMLVRYSGEDCSSPPAIILIVHPHYGRSYSRMLRQCAKVLQPGIPPCEGK